MKRLWLAVKSFLRELGSLLQSLADNGDWAPKNSSAKPASSPDLSDLDDGFNEFWAAHGPWPTAESSRGEGLHNWRCMRIMILDIQKVPITVTGQDSAK